MQNAKNSLFLYLTPRQKSQLLGTLKSYAKKFDLGSEDLAYKFLEDEKYYLDINNPHFEFVKDYLDDDKFFSDSNLIIVLFGTDSTLHMLLKLSSYNNTAF